MHMFIALGIVVSLSFGHSDAYRLNRKQVGKRKQASKADTSDSRRVERTNATGYGCCIVGPEDAPYACQHMILSEFCVPDPPLKHLNKGGCPDACPPKPGYGNSWFDPFYAQLGDDVFLELGTFEEVKTEYMKPLVVAMALGLQTQALVARIGGFIRSNQREAEASASKARVNSRIDEVQKELPEIEKPLRAKGWSWQGDNGRKKFEQDGAWASNRRMFQGLVQALRRTEEDCERAWESYIQSKDWLEDQIKAVGTAAAKRWDSLPSLDPAAVQEKCAEAIAAVKAC